MTIAARICEEVLNEALRAAPPRSILALGPETGHIFDAFLHEHPDIRLHAIEGKASPADLAAAGPHDLALVANTLERMETKAAQALLAALRDLYARRLYVLVPLGERWPDSVSHWDAQEMTAFGLGRVARYEDRGREIALFRHDLYDYKTTPDWLNAKYWANPELWDKYRW